MVGGPDDVVGGDIVVPNGESVQALGTWEGEKSGGEGGVRGKEYLILGRPPWRVGE